MASRVYYNSAYLWEQEEAKKYKGRGKYKRTKNQYFAYMYNKEGEQIGSLIAFGWKDLKEQRSRFAKSGRGRYRIEVFNATKNMRRVK